MVVAMLIAVSLVVLTIILNTIILRRFFFYRNVDVEHLERGPMISQRIPEPEKPLEDGCDNHWPTDWSSHASVEF